MNNFVVGCLVGVMFVPVIFELVSGHYLSALSFVGAACFLAITAPAFH